MSKLQCSSFVANQYLHFFRSLLLNIRHYFFCLIKLFILLAHLILLVFLYTAMVHKK